MASSMAKTRRGASVNGYGEDWATPQKLYDELDKEFQFTLDVCASDWNFKHPNYFTKEQDGLNQDWTGHRCWMNPPYGRALELWMKKAYESNCLVVCLVPSSTDLNWWHEYATKGEIRFIRKRPKFLHRDGTKTNIFTPSSIIIFRPR